MAIKPIYLLTMTKAKAVLFNDVFRIKALRPLSLSNQNTMEYQLKTNEYSVSENKLRAVGTDEIARVISPFFGIGKKSFLVYQRNKYMTVPTDSIAFFYIKYEATLIVTMDKQEYSVNYSLDRVQQLLPGHQFFRVNRQYLVNFNAIREVEHYFARKLLVVPTVAFQDKLVVPKEKAKTFLDWLENR
jgi:DNA-binding LytR/AlgR family response regulator